MRRIIIEDAGGGPDTPPAAADNGAVFDLQDTLLLGGLVFSELGAAVIWWPAALLLAAIYCFGFAWMIERAKSKNGPPQP